MKYACDFHIHSCLSPCGDELMTPNNIVNMSKLKELDIIAITDHNSCKNAKVTMNLGNKAGLLVLPGMELTTIEEIHLLCLFADLKTALTFQGEVENNFNTLKNKSEIFGNQYVMDEEDELLYEEEKMLIGASNLTSDDAFALVRNLGGFICPAHVNRQSFSMFSSFGLIPDHLGIKTLEFSYGCDIDSFVLTNRLKGYKKIVSSDAHYIDRILEREFYIEAGAKSREAVIKALNEGTF